MTRPLYCAFFIRAYDASICITQITPLRLRATRGRFTPTGTHTNIERGPPFTHISTIQRHTAHSHHRSSGTERGRWSRIVASVLSALRCRAVDTRFLPAACSCSSPVSPQSLCALHGRPVRGLRMGSEEKQATPARQRTEGTSPHVILHS